MNNICPNNTIHWGNMPQDIAIHLFTKADLRVILRCTLVSKEWQALLQEKSIWRPILRTMQYPFESEENFPKKIFQVTSKFFWYNKALKNELSLENLKNAFKANIYLYRLNLSSWPQLEKMAAIMMKNYQCEEGWKILANEKIQQGCWKDATHIAKEHLIEEKANFKIALVKATLTPQQLEQSLKLIEAFKEAPYSELQPVVDKFMDLAIKINRLDLAEKAMTLFPESISTLFTKIPNFIEEKKENIALWVLDHCQKVLKNDPNAIHQAIKYYVHLGVAKKAIALAKSYYQTNLSE